MLFHSQVPQVWWYPVLPVAMRLLSIRFRPGKSGGVDGNCHAMEFHQFLIHVPKKKRNQTIIINLWYSQQIGINQGLVNVLFGDFFHITKTNIWILYHQKLADVKHWDIVTPTPVDSCHFFRIDGDHWHRDSVVPVVPGHTEWDLRSASEGTASPASPLLP